MADLTGIDLCAIPAGTPPDGYVSNFVDPPTLAPIIIPITTIMMSSAVLITAGRIFVNRKKLAWSDYFAIAAVPCSLADASLMLYQLPIARHAWDVPVCWLLDGTVKLILARSFCVITGTFLAKTSILLLFHQLFALERRVKMAIWTGSAAAFMVWVLSLTYQCITLLSEARSGESSVHNTYWPILNSVLYLVLDLYLLLLPLPIIAKLNWSTKTQLKAAAVFSTALLSVTATIVSLVFRVQLAANGSDSTWKACLVLLCVMAEAHIAVIVSSMPGFSKFLKLHVKQTQNGGEQSLELGDSWLFKTNTTTEVSANLTPGLQLMSAPGVRRTLYVKQAVSEPFPSNVVIKRGITGNTYHVLEDEKN